MLGGQGGGLLAGGHRQWRVGGDLLGQRLGDLDEFVGLGEPVDEPDLVGARGRQRRAGEHEFHHDAPRNHQWKRRGPGGASSHLDLGDPELRRGGGHAQIADLGQQETAGEGHPIDRGDRRFVHRDVAAELRDEVDRRDGQPVFGHLLEITARAERLVAGTGEHQDLGGVVGVEGADAVEQAIAHRLVQRVARFGPLDGQPGDAVADLVADAHCSSPCTTASTAPESTCWP